MVAKAEVVRIIEEESIAPDAMLINGLPGAGLVGLIAASYLISKLKLQKVAYVESDLLPPVTVMHRGEPHHPVRIYAKGNLLVLMSEIPIPNNIIYPLCRAIVKWALSRKMSRIVSIGGLQVENRQVVKQPKVFGMVSSKELAEMLKQKEIPLLMEGYIVGPYGIMTLIARQMKVPCINLLTQSFFKYPDPEAAAVAISVLNKLFGLNVDPKKLMEEGEQIRLRAKDLMQRTHGEMLKTKKESEQDVPPMYV